MTVPSGDYGLLGLVILIPGGASVFAVGLQSVLSRL